MASKKVKVSFKCWSCQKHNVQEKVINVDNQIGSLNYKRKPKIDFVCDDPNCKAINAVEVDA